MSFYRSSSVSIVTDGAGAATAYTSDFLNGGHVESVTITTGTLVAGTDWTITDDATGAAILTLTNVNTGTFRPRGATHDTVGAASLYTTGFAVNDKIAISGRIKIVVAQGGAATAGTISFIVS